MTVFDEPGRDDEPLGSDAPFEPDDNGDSDRLALDDDDEQLPWLESAEDYEEPGVDTGRIIGIALIGLVAVLAIVGGIWWGANRGAGPSAVADGSTIEAPDEPYKTKPEDPGGKTFAGTGDTSFKVGEGQKSEGRIAAPKPVPEPETTPAPDTGDAEAAKPGVGVQVGAYSNRAAAQAGWNTLRGRHEALSGVDHRIVQGKADIGVVYRLQALAGSVGEAEALCERLKADGASCQVKR